MEGELTTSAAPASPPADDGVPSPPPPAIPDHELLRCIGRGSYGDVWLARSVLGHLRAVKLICRSRFADPRPFEREFEGIQKFEEISRSHPSQLAILHVGKNDAAGCFYYVMELADDATAPVAADVRRLTSSPSETGDLPPKQSEPPHVGCYEPRTLRHDLEQHGRLPIPDCVRIGLSLATALAHLHEQGLVHRDIKPSNILFVKGGAKLGDIGLVTEAGDTRSIVGTEGYLPPEGPGTPPADLYSLGKVLYEISTGLDRRQFPALPKDSWHWPDCGLLMEFNEIVLRACARNPAQRYGTADALRADLELLGAGKSVKRRRAALRLGKALALVGGIALVTLGVTFAAREGLVPGFRATTPQLNWGYGTPTNQAAQQAYALGRSFTQLATPESLAEGRKRYVESLRLEPGCALTYSALAANWRIEAYAGSTFGRDAYTRVRELALEALRLAPDLEVGHEKLGSVASALDYDWLAAERSFRRALTLNPDNIQVHENFIYHLLVPQGRFPEARAEVQGLGRLSVLDGRFEGSRGLSMEAWVAYYAHEFERSRDLYHQLADLEPKEPEHQRMLARVLEAQGDFPAARAIYERELADSPRFRAMLKAGLIITQARAGETNVARAGLEELRAHSGENRAAISLAWVYTALGEPDLALDSLETAYERREHEMLYIKVDPRLEALHGQPRFQDLLRKMNLKPD